MLDVLISTLKYLGVMIGSASGIYGLFVKYKADDGKITPAGRNALVLIVASGLVALGSIVLEGARTQRDRLSASEQRAKETLEAVQRTEKTLFQVNRGLQLISDVYGTYRIRVSLDSETLKGYRDRMLSQLASLMPRLSARETAVGTYVSQRNAKEGVITVTFSSKSPLAPKKEAELLAFTLLSYADVALFFYKEPIPPHKFLALTESTASVNDMAFPDLSFELDSYLDPSPQEQTHSIQYDVNDRTFSIWATSIFSDSKYWRSSGKIISVQDLWGAQLFLFPKSNVVSGNAETDAALAEIRKGFDLQFLSLRMSKGREIILRGKNLTKVANARGLPLYVYQFPSTDEEFSALESK